MLFKNNYKVKRRACEINIHKAMQFFVGIYQTNKKIFVIVQPKNTCKLELVDHLWLPFIDQRQYDIVVFAINIFLIYKIIVSKWKHGIGPDDIITFDKKFEIISTSIIELVNIDESSYKEKVLIFITSRLLDMTKNNLVHSMMMKSALNYPLQKKCI